jgi:hypothetical protein
MRPAGIVAPYAGELFTYSIVQLWRHRLLSPGRTAEAIVFHRNLVNVRVNRNDFGLPKWLSQWKWLLSPTADLVKAHEQNAVRNFTADSHQLQQLFSSMHGVHAAEGMEPPFWTLLPLCR